MTAAAPGAGVNLIGLLSANLGLGLAARNTLSLLQAKGVPVAALDVDAGMGRSLHETSFRGLCVASGERLPYGINLWHMNPPEVSGAMAGGLRVPWKRFNAAVPYWELPTLPASWFQALDAMDMILAPSRFVECLLVAGLRRARVRYYPQPFRMPEPAGLTRADLGIPAGDVVFAAGFDFGSSLDRKNPLGVLEAFIRAFRDRPRVHLLVKTNNKGMTPDTARLADFIRGKFRPFPNVRFFDETMPYAKVLALYRCADVYVSLHRAEGLGLGMMECMAMGMPVIATGWSGNMDFMRESNSCLVRHRLVPVDPATMYGAMLEGASALWAEPDAADAGRWMRRLADDPELRRRLGGRAAEDIRRFAGEASWGRALDEMQAQYARWAADPSVSPAEPDWRARYAAPERIG